MSKLRITFEVDTSELFDRLQALKGDFGPIGQRVIGAMLTGETGTSDAIGMAFYGIILEKTERVAL